MKNAKIELKFTDNETTIKNFKNRIKMLIHGGA